MLKFNLLISIYIVLIISTLIYTEGIVLYFGVIILTLLFISIIVWGVASIRSQMFVKTFNANPEKSKSVAITFDDGPHKTNTPRILEILKKHNAKASFFLIGKNIAENENIAKVISDNGHTIGNHSYFHGNNFPLLSPKKMIKELTDNQSLIEKITQHRTKYFRPPFGVTNHFIAKAVKSLNLKVIGWNIRSFDTNDSKPKEIILNNIIKNIKGGDIILLHDKSKDIFWITEELLNYLQRNNISPVTIDELFN